MARDRELAEVRELLADPACRLLTLVGPGGIGKTRLAVAAATPLGGFADGVYFIALQPIQTLDFLVPAIADAAGITLAGHEPLFTQLLNNLQNKQLLLLLDNFEHLLGGANLLANILHAAPNVKLLVTSREVLGLREEWLYPVDGLSVPATTTTHHPATYGAVQLFGERARQVRHDFTLKDEIEAVISICHQVGGNPLAVELAASWLAVLNCKTIAAQIQENLDILATTLRNIPERHRSMRAVFDQTWQLLNDDERNVFCRLTVFTGGCTHQTAQAVAGASLPLLSSLVSKSLLRRLANGRYQIHELLRQYGAEKLAASSGVETAAQEAYSAYFMAFLAERRSEFDGRGQLQAVQEIANELENIRNAWQWAVHHVQAETIHTALRAYFFFYQHRSRYLEGAETFADAVRHLESSEVQGARGAALAESLTYFGWLCIRLSRLAEANEALARARHLYAMLGIPPPQYRAGDPITALLILALVQGDYEQALILGEQACRQAEQHNQPAALSFAYYGLANALLAQGEYAQAHTYAEQGLALNNSIENRWLSSYCHDVLGQIAYVQEELQAAKRHFESAFAIRAEFENPGGMALSLKNLGEVSARQQDWHEANGLYARSLELYRELGDRGGVASTQCGLGVAAYHLGDLDAAHRHFRRALEVAVVAQIVPLVLAILTEVGEFLLQISGVGNDDKVLGLRILTYVRQHPSRDQQTHDRILRYLAHNGYPADAQPEPHDTLDSLTQAAQTELATAARTSSLTLATQAQGLVEPLTRRETEVLRLLATGHSNPAIAEELMVALGTVKAHTSSIYRKLDVANRTQAVACARELGLLP